jgi:thymidylate kinase
MYEQIDVMKNVRINYFKAFDRLKDLEKIAVVDGNRSLEKVEDAILNEISKLEGRL